MLPRSAKETILRLAFLSTVSVIVDPAGTVRMSEKGVRRP